METNCSSVECLKSMSDVFEGSSPKTLMKISEIVVGLVTSVTGVARLRFFIKKTPI